uniref:dynein intermediate chain 2, ciliary-like n=1 Tax=Myxine glutinosa TaxID=7769 RepID=UPI00358E77B5
MVANIQEFEVGDAEEQDGQEMENDESTDVKKWGFECAGAHNVPRIANQFNYNERASQTFNNPQREQTSQTEPRPKANFSDTVNQWKIYDVYREESLKQKHTEDETTTTTSKLSHDDYKKPVSMGFQSNDMRNIGKAAKIMERVVNMNIYDEIAQDYKYFEDASAEFHDMEGTLLPLWHFHYEKAKKLAVTALCWSPHYEDLIAAGYGSCKYALPHPFKEYFMDTMLSIDHCIVKWQKDDMDNNLNFFSISSDGRIVSWTILKNEFVPVEVMQLTSDPPSMLHNPQVLHGRGTSFDFHREMDHIFLVGTEEGTIHKCSKMYSRRYLESFAAHNMAVEAVRWNHFHPNVFISCSADYTIKIWDQTSRIPLFVFNLWVPIADVAWAPYSSTVFAAVTSDGKVLVFDLAVNKYEAMCQQSVATHKTSKLTHLAFSPSSPVLTVGDDRGYVLTLKLSPNLRHKPKALKGQSAILRGPKMEMEKLEKVLDLVKQP